MMRGDVLIGMGRVQDALAESRQAAEVLDRLVTARPRDLEVLLQAASCHEGVADMAGCVGIPSGIGPRRVPGGNSSGRSNCIDAQLKWIARRSVRGARRS